MGHENDCRSPLLLHRRKMEKPLYLHASESVSIVYIEGPHIRHDFP